MKSRKIEIGTVLVTFEAGRWSRGNSPCASLDFCVSLKIFVTKKRQHIAESEKERWGEEVREGARENRREEKKKGKKERRGLCLAHRRRAASRGCSVLASEGSLPTANESATGNVLILPDGGQSQNASSQLRTHRFLSCPFP